MKDSELNIRQIDPTLYNEDLAPIPHTKRTWGWFEIFNVWSNDIQSLFGYTLDELNTQFEEAMPLSGQFQVRIVYVVERNVTSSQKRLRNYY